MGILAPDGLLDRACRELLGDAIRHRPADHLPGERVYDGSEAGPSLLGRDARDAAHPKLVLLADGKRPLHDVEPGVARLDRLSDPVLSRGALGDEAEPPHDVQHALLAGEYARLPQFPVDAPITVPCAMPFEGLFDEPLQGFSLYLRIRLASVRVFVITRFRDLRQLARLPDGAEPIPMLFGELEPHAWS